MGWGVRVRMEDQERDKMVGLHYKQLVHRLETGSLDLVKLPVLLPQEFQVDLWVQLLTRHSLAELVR